MASYQTSLIFQNRGKKRAEIKDFFVANLGQKFSSYRLTVRFGQGLRSRISEINLDESEEITIHNEHFFDPEVGRETGCYWAELRPRHLDLG